MWFEWKSAGDSEKVKNPRILYYRLASLLYFRFDINVSGWNMTYLVLRQKTVLMRPIRFCNRTHNKMFGSLSRLNYYPEMKTTASFIYLKDSSCYVVTFIVVYHHSVCAKLHFIYPDHFVTWFEKSSLSWYIKKQFLLKQHSKSETLQCNYTINYRSNLQLISFNCVKYILLYKPLCFGQLMIHV